MQFSLRLGPVFIIALAIAFSSCMDEKTPQRLLSSGKPTTEIIDTVPITAPIDTVPSNQPARNNQSNSNTSLGGPKKIDTVITHQNKRFAVLKTILDKNPKYIIKFPGKSATEHALGTGIAASSWGGTGSDDHKKLVANIATQIQELMIKYPSRIQFGLIGDFKFKPATKDCDRSLANTEGLPGPQANGTFVIHVWGANEGNFNYANNYPGESWGAGQATCFAKQRIGVFGISTMPSNDKATLMADDKLLPLYH